MTDHVTMRMSMDLSKKAVDRFFAMMVERENIRLRRAANQPWPWTDDPILRGYKFTNVKRTDDKTTRLLKREFYDEYRNQVFIHHGLESAVEARRIVLLNCAIARYFGTIEFMNAIGWQTRWDPKLLKRTARERLNRKERVYTGAYLISPCNHTGPKENVVVDIFLADLWRQSDSVVRMLTRDDVGGHWGWKNIHTRLSEVEGFGGTGFMAKETILDTRLVPGFWGEQPRDRMTWTPVGPGSRRGAGRMIGDDAGGALNNSNTLEVCRELFARHGDYWPGDFVALELHDIQFQLCEFSKYEKVRLGQGRPRSIYRKPEEKKQ